MNPALLVTSVHVQIRRVKEPYLLRVSGPTYRDYLATVGRFAPDVGVRR